MLSADTLLFVRNTALQEHDEFLCSAELQRCDRAADELFQAHRVLAWALEHPDSRPGLRSLIGNYQELIDFAKSELGLTITASTEGFIWGDTKEVIKNTINAIIRFVMRIIEIIWDFIKRIFLRQYRLTRQLEDYQRHFSSHPIDSGRFEQHQDTSFLPCDTLQKWVLGMHQLTFDLAPVFAAFEAKGQITRDSLELNAVFQRLKGSSLFIITEDHVSGCLQVTTNGVAIEQCKISGRLGEHGWSSYSLQECIRHTIDLLGRIDTMKDIQKSLKKAMVDRVADHVTDPISHNRYIMGVKAIQQLTSGFAAQAMALAQQTVLMAGVAKRFCQ